MEENDMTIDKKQLLETDIRTKYITPAIEAAGWNKMTKHPISRALCSV